MWGVQNRLRQDLRERGRVGINPDGNHMDGHPRASLTPQSKGEESQQTREGEEGEKTWGSLRRSEAKAMFFKPEKKGVTYRRRRGNRRRD